MIDQLSLSLQVKPSKNKARNLPLLSFITAVSIFISLSNQHNMATTTRYCSYFSQISAITVAGHGSFFYFA